MATKYIPWLGICLLALFSPLFCQTASAEPSSARLTPVARIVRNSAPAVVNITCSSQDRARKSPLELFMDPDFGILGQPRKRMSLGTGIIVDGKRGIVLTNAHVISDADEIMVRLQDGREFAAKIMGMEPDFDLAALEISNAPNLPSIPLGDSSDLMPGETVIAIGNPFGLHHTVTTGVVSAINRSLRNNNGMLTELVQTDAAINPGNSGGPLLNMDGAIIGINTVIDARGEGLGFAIPASKAKESLERMTRHESPKPVWLGIMATDISSRQSRQPGILVTDVHKNSPAFNAGLKKGDIIRSINSGSVRDCHDYLAILRNQTRNSPLEIEWDRGGTRLRSAIKPQDFDDTTALQLMDKYWGIELGTKDGHVIITSARGPAAFLKPGDIVTAVGQRKIRTIKDALNGFRLERMTGEAILGIERGRRAYYARIVVGGK